MSYMWIRTVNELQWIEVEQNHQGMWIPKRRVNVPQTDLHPPQRL